MICKKCGKTNSEKDKFCGVCGWTLADQEKQASENMPEEIKPKEVKLQEANPETILPEERQEIPQEDKQRNKSIIIIGAILVAFIVVVIGVMHMDWGPDPIEVMRAQLEELNSDSYRDINEWVNDEFPEFEEELEEFDLFIRAFTTQGNLVDKTFLGLESRFVEWQFELDENRLEIELVYLTFEEYITKQLLELDNSSFEEIGQWIRDNENQADLEIRIQSTTTNEDILHHFDVNKGEEFFVTWDFEMSDFLGTIRVNIVYTFEVKKTFALGETFEFSGIEFTFVDNIWGGRIDNYWSANDGQAYFAVPVVVKNISDEAISIFRFDMTRLGNDGREQERLFTTGHQDVIHLVGEIRPGESREGHLYFVYTGEGEYAVGMSSPVWNTPFEVEVTIPVYDIDIPEAEDRYNRDVPIPDVVFDLHEITLFNHVLAADSFFYTAPYTSELGNTYTILQPGDIVRDPEGVITHDSLRIRYSFFEVCEERYEDGFDIVEVMEELAWHVQQGGNPAEPIGDIRVNSDETSGFLQIRDGVGLDFLTRLIVIELLPGEDEYVIFETWLWTINEEWLEGERRAAVEEFGQLTGIDFIQILRDTYEGIDVIRERILGENWEAD